LLLSSGEIVGQGVKSDVLIAKLLHLDGLALNSFLLDFNSVGAWAGADDVLGLSELVEGCILECLLKLSVRVLCFRVKVGSNGVRC